MTKISKIYIVGVFITWILSNLVPIIEGSEFTFDSYLQRLTKRLVSGCENFVLALA